VGGLSPDETPVLSQPAAPSNSAQSTTTANLALKSLVKGASPQVWLTLNPPGSRMGFIAPRRSNSGSHEALQVKSAQVDSAPNAVKFQQFINSNYDSRADLDVLQRSSKAFSVVSGTLYLIVFFIATMNGCRLSPVAPPAHNGLL
jgi:hypothetical protein